jgi:hypothetical protein
MRQRADVNDKMKALLGATRTGRKERRKEGRRELLDKRRKDTNDGVRVRACRPMQIYAELRIVGPQQLGTLHCGPTTTRYTTLWAHNNSVHYTVSPQSAHCQLHQTSKLTVPTTQTDRGLFCWCCTVHAARISFRSATCSLSHTRILSNIPTFTTGRDGSVRRRQTSATCYQASIWIFVIM